VHEFELAYAHLHVPEMAWRWGRARPHRARPSPPGSTRCRRTSTGGRWGARGGRKRSIAVWPGESHEDRRDRRRFPAAGQA